VLGAVFGVLPDLVLSAKRTAFPPERYNMTHSLVFVGMVGAIAGWATGSVVPLLALLSHIVLDIPTHGRIWAPPLLYPWRDTRYSAGAEWEWFSRSWWIGLIITFIWSGGCFLVSGFRIGFQ
jgi:membrane-bound metal-dependent hydrolase YbcI (DUF457 family)